MTELQRWLWNHLAVAFLLELLFLAFLWPLMGRYSTYEAQVWKQFWLGCAAVLILYTIWPALYSGDLWLRLVGALLCVLPSLTLAWVVMDHYDLYPDWM